MKKFISSTLALTLIASALAGCSSNTASTSDSGSAPESSTPSSQAESNTQAEQTNTEKALALIGTFASGDTDTARELLDENYIQHNLAYGTGRMPLSAPWNTWRLPMQRPPWKTSVPLRTGTMCSPDRL